VPVTGLAVRWCDAGEGSVERAEPPPQVKKIFLYTDSVVRVSAGLPFIADLRNGGPGMADRNGGPRNGGPESCERSILKADEPILMQIAR